MGRQLTGRQLTGRQLTGRQLTGRQLTGRQLTGRQLTGRLCSCGHPAEAHRHYRPGRDCGICGQAVCARYRPRGGLAGLTGLLAARRRARAARQAEATRERPGDDPTDQRPAARLATAPG